MTEDAKEKTKSILCVGECSLNIVHICNELPCKTKDINTNTGYWQRGGHSSIICTILSILGSKSEFMGYLSTSPESTFITKDFNKYNINIANCPTTDEPQPYSSIMISTRNCGVHMYHANFGFPRLTFSQFSNAIKMEDYCWIHFEGSNLAESKRMINHVRRYNTTQNAENRICISTELLERSRDPLILAIRSDTVFVGRDFASYMGWQTPKETIFSMIELLTNLQLRENKEEYEMDLCFYSPHIIYNCHPGNVALLTKDYVFHQVQTRTNLYSVDTLGYNETLIGAYINALINNKKSQLEALDIGMKLSSYKSEHYGFDCIVNYNETPESKPNKK